MSGWIILRVPELGVKGLISKLLLKPPPEAGCLRHTLGQPTILLNHTLKSTTSKSKITGYYFLNRQELPVVSQPGPELAL